MKDKNFIIFIFCSAFLMLGTSAYFSIVGISSLFSGRKFFAGILATAMEFSKVTMTSHLTRNWKTEILFKKILLMFFIGCLILFSSIGIYSYLADSYQMTTYKLKSVESELNTYKLQEKILIDEKNQLIDDNNNIDNQINSISAMNNELISQRIQLQQAMNADTTGTVNWYVSINRCNIDINTNNKELNELRLQRKTNINKLSTINEKLQILWKNTNAVETSEEGINAGPLKVLSTIFNTNMNTVVKWLLIFIVAIFDPIGVVLIITFNQLQKNNNVKNIFTEIKNDIQYDNMNTDESSDEDTLNTDYDEPENTISDENLTELNTNNNLNTENLNSDEDISGTDSGGHETINIEKNQDSNIYDEQIEHKKVKISEDPIPKNKKLDVYVNETGGTVINV